MDHQDISTCTSVDVERRSPSPRVTFTPEQNGAINVVMRKRLATEQRRHRDAAAVVAAAHDAEVTALRQHNLTRLEQLDGHLRSVIREQRAQIATLQRQLYVAERWSAGRLLRRVRNLFASCIFLLTLTT